MKNDNILDMPEYSCCISAYIIDQQYEDTKHLLKPKNRYCVGCFLVNIPFIGRVIGSIFYGW